MICFLKTHAAMDIHVQASLIDMHSASENNAPQNQTVLQPQISATNAMDLAAIRTMNVIHLNVLAKHAVQILHAPLHSTLTLTNVRE